MGLGTEKSSSLNVNDSAVFAPQSHVVSCDLDGGRALLDLNDSSYFKLNSTGASIWQWLEAKPSTVEDLTGKMVEAFDVQADQCRGDIAFIMSTFLDAGLVAEHGDQRA